MREDESVPISEGCDELVPTSVTCDELVPIMITPSKQVFSGAISHQMLSMLVSFSANRTKVRLKVAQNITFEVENGKWPHLKTASKQPFQNNGPEFFHG